MWNAWASISAARPESYSVARELQSIAKKEGAKALQPAVQAFPNYDSKITTRQARKLVREWKQKDQPPKAKGDHWTVKHTKRWFNDVVERATKAIEDGEVAKDDRVDPATISEAIEPDLLKTVRDGAQAWNDLADFLDHVLDKESTKEEAVA